MNAIPLSELEVAFHGTIEEIRRGKNQVPIESDALFCHAVFYLNNNITSKTSSKDRALKNMIDGLSFETTSGRLNDGFLPFKKFWVVSNFNKLVFSALVGYGSSGLKGDDHILIYWSHSHISKGKGIGLLSDDMNARANEIVERAIASMQTNEVTPFDSEIRDTINRGRAKTLGKPSYIPPLPAFIRITDNPRTDSAPKGGHHASPIGHDRRGHWRTYKATGKRVWIKAQRINGGSVMPRSYLID